MEFTLNLLKKKKGLEECCIETSKGNDNILNNSFKLEKKKIFKTCI